MVNAELLETASNAAKILDTAIWAKVMGVGRFPCEPAWCLYRGREFAIGT